MQSKIPIIKKHWSEWDIALVLYVLCIFSASVERLFNYVTLLTICFLLLHTFKSHRIYVGKINMLWVIYLLIYPFGDYLRRCQTGPVNYILFGYAVPLIFLLVQDRHLEKHKAAEYYIMLLACFETIGFILKNVWYSLYVKIAYRIIARWNHAVGSFTTDNTVAAFMISVGIAISFIWWMECEKKDPVKKRKLLYIIMFLLIGLLLSSKRTIFLATLICCGIIFFINRVDNLQKAIKYIIIGVLTAIVFVGISIFVYHLYGASNVIGRLGGTFIGLAEGEDVTNFRSNLAEYMMKWWRETTSTTVYGIGWGNFRGRIVDYVYVPNGHCVYRQLLCEEGIIGFAVFVLLSAITVIMSLRNVLLFRKKPGTIENEMANISLFVQVLFLIYSYTGNALYDVYCYLYFFLSIGWTALLNTQLKMTRRKRGKVNR